MRPAILTLAAAALLAPHAGAQTIAITGGRVHPVSGPVIENGTVLIRGGRIAAVGANVTVPADAQRIDAAGKWVTPGLIAGATALGVVEVGAVNNTVDVSARQQPGNGIQAAFTVWAGINPLSVLIAAARNDGVTSVGVVPAGGLVAGQGAFMDLVEGSARDMVTRSPMAMMAAIAARGEYIGNARGETIGRLRQLLDDTRSYQRRRAEFERNQTRTFAASRADLEAMIPVVEGRLPLMVDAERRADIEAALQIARDYRLRMIITGGADAWMVADQLAAANVPVFVGAMNNIPNDFSALGARQDNAAMLQRAGVKVIINGSGGESFNVRNVKYEAGVAVAYGLPWEEALRAITLSPAEALGVADRVGTLQAGRDANVVVWSGDPFEFTTRAEHVIIRGREYRTPSRQDQLMERYKSLPPNYRRP